MLQVYHSNRMEQLVQALSSCISLPLSDPMCAESIVVQNPGMARWLSQQIAGSLGIAANLEFPLPASFIWRIYQHWIPDLLDQAGFDRDSLKWRVLEMLPERLASPLFAPLQRYLKTDEDELRAYQLSGRIADLFDQYLVYRPDMLLAWEQGQQSGANPDEAWQASLWRDVVASSGGQHRAALFARFRDLQTQGEAPVTPLPERVCVFGISALAPVYLQVLNALAQHTQVHLFLLNPCREYWADIQDDKGQARRRGRWRQSGQQDVSSLLDVGNPLLASMGQAGQVFIDQLLELNVQEHDLFQSVAGDTLLGRVQQDILQLQDRRTADTERRCRIAAEDVSLQVHACHSPMREVQVLHDQLRQLFERMPELQPRQIVVMAPDISAYAPYVQAVFGAANDARYIPWTLADQAPQEQIPILGALTELLHLPGFRFEASRVIALLEVPAVAARFDIDAEGLEHIRRWVAETAIRWGSDGAMRASLELPAESANTWDSGLERMFQGYALPVGAELQQGLLPYSDIEGGDAVYLGKLAAFIECLQLWQQRLAMAANPQIWVKLISQLLADFFTPAAEEEILLQAVRSAMDNMWSHCSVSQFERPLFLNVVRSELEQALESQSSGMRFLQGGVTFCNMVPMRSIPFSVVCLLGMNDKDYPRREQPLSFDLMAASPKPADRSRRMDDRYLFLEAMVSARQALYLSYTGHDVKDNSARVPSVVLSELLDYLQASYKSDGSEALQQLVVNHPLQPFSYRYFDASNPRLFSYDAGWLAAADVRSSLQQSPFMDTSLQSATSSVEVELNDLLRFMVNPAAWFLGRCMGVSPAAEGLVLEDEEPFVLDTLTAYQLKSEVLESIRAGEDSDACLPTAQASGELPHGIAGIIDYAAQTEQLAELAARVEIYEADRLAPLEVDLQINGFHLSGWLDRHTTRGLLRYRPAKLKPKDRLQLWVQHLVLCALTDEPEVISVHVAADKTQLFQRVENPKQRLAELLTVWQQGQQQPLPFFPGAALKYVETDDLDKACKQWEKDYDSGAENWYVQVAYRGLEPVLQPDFAQLAKQLVGPLLEAGNVVAAKDEL